MTRAAPGFEPSLGMRIPQGQPGELTQSQPCWMPSPHSAGWEPAESHPGHQLVIKMDLLAFFFSSCLFAGSGEEAAAVCTP